MRMKVGIEPGWKRHRPRERKQSLCVSLRGSPRSPAGDRCGTESIKLPSLTLRIFFHESRRLMPKRAVLLVNLGSPESPGVPDVRNYLNEFLGDERVIDRPPEPFRSVIFQGIVIPRRAPKSAHA